MQELNPQQLQLKEDKKNHIKRIFKDKLGLSNINELVILVKSYNGGMFGCTQNQDQTASGPSITNNNNLIFGGMGESTHNPQESGTIGAALGITLSEANQLGSSLPDQMHNNEVSFFGKCALLMDPNISGEIKMTES